MTTARFLRGMIALMGATALLASGCRSPMPSALPEQALQAPVWLLGEVHDNPQAHHERLAQLRERLAQGWRPVLAMEQFDREHQSTLDAALARCASARCVIDAVGSSTRGWDWPLYEPVLDLARQYGLRVRAANVSRADVRRVSREGFAAALAPETIARFALDAPLPADLVEGQLRELEQGHCSKLPPAMVKPMVSAQVVRDVWMAQVLLEEVAAGRPVVLLAGNGHVRRDLGVPRWLGTLEPSRVFVEGFVESEDAVASTAYDRIRRVPVAPREDPCAGIRAPAR